MYADPNTRMCVQKCDPDLGFFGDSGVTPKACVAICKSSTYANPFSQTCQNTCPTFPKMYAFDNGDAVNPIR